jgi:hypothetical protein
MACIIIYSKWSWNISVNIVTRSWAEQPKDCGLIASREKRLVFSKMSTTVLKPTEPTFKWVKKKVKCTLVQALRLCTGRTAHRENRGIALPFHDHGARRG